jgi:hypothetical protein
VFSVLWFGESYYPERDLFGAIILIPLYNAQKAIMCSSEMCICVTFRWKNISTVVFDRVCFLTAYFVSDLCVRRRPGCVFL